MVEHSLAHLRQPTRRSRTLTHDSTLTGSDEVDDIEAIKQLKARYLRAVDTRDWELCRANLSDDFVISTGFHDTAGADQVVESLSTALRDVVTIHHAHTPEIRLTSGTTATGIWACEDLARHADGRRVAAYGHHHETYEKIDGSWKMKSQTMEWVFHDANA